jgi:hypothetical protein
MELRFLTLLAVLVAHAVSEPGAVADPQKPNDSPLPVGAEYKGKLTQQGKHPKVTNLPPEFEAVFVITKRDAEKFEAETRLSADGANVTYLTKGKVAAPNDAGTCDFKCEWTGVKDSSGGYISVPGVPLTGTVKGGKFKGTWQYPHNNDGIVLSGTFEMERVIPKPK